MAAGPSIDVSAWLEEQLAQASPDLLRAMVTTFAEALMGAEADAICGAAYGERSEERTNTRNGYRRRDWDTRAGSIGLAIPKLRRGSYFPDWLLERRRRAEAALERLGIGAAIRRAAAGRRGGRAGRHRPPAARRHQNAYLKSHSWDDYAKWHFGLTVGAKDGTKARYAFVYGDFRRIHRMGLIACSYRAAESRHKEIELTADELLQYLDTKSERRRKR